MIFCIDFLLQENRPRGSVAGRVYCRQTKFPAKEARKVKQPKWMMLLKPK
jgi:hypothetical protein